MFTTTGDLRAFWESLFSYRILSEELTRTFLQTHHRFNDRVGYGCGIYKRLDGRAFWISGVDAGVGFDSRYVVQEQVTINLLSNVTHGESRLRGVVLDYLAGRYPYGNDEPGLPRAREELS
jgi:hypothetical protein